MPLYRPTLKNPWDNNSVEIPAQLIQPAELLHGRDMEQGMPSKSPEQQSYESLVL